MSVRPNLNKGRVVTGMLIVLPVLLISIRAFAQSDSNPKWDSFVGSQGLQAGGTNPAPLVAPAATCSVQPSEVIVGEPVTATVTASNFNPKHTLTYVWNPSGGGGKVIGTDRNAEIETTNAAPGNYIVTVHVTDAQEKKNNEAICTANFTVKPPPPKNPPTMSISASPTSVPAGGTVNLSTNCTSADGVPVTVSTWTSIGGTVSGTGGSATLDTAGVSPGAIVVSAICTDSRGLNAQASTEVMVEKPPTPPPPPPAPPNPSIEVTKARLALRSIYFPTDMPPMENPDAGLVASQQQILVALAADFKKYLESQPEAHLLLEGHADPRGRTKYDQNLSERRADRVKGFLVKLGVPQANIDTKAFGALHALREAAVKDAIENNPQLSPEERQRALRNLQTIVLASDRRVDITLSMTGQSSVRQFPFNAADAVTLIGGREVEGKKKTAKPAPKKRTN